MNEGTHVPKSGAATVELFSGPPAGVSVKDTQTHLSEPVPDAPLEDAENGTGSPLSLAESHARLELSASKLGVAVRDAKTKSDEAMLLYRKLRDELDETTRAIKAMDRIRHPQKRVKL